MNRPSHLSKPVSYQHTAVAELDLNVDNYSLQDLFRLFNITDAQLSEDSMKQAKQIVLKMHPDKSRLESKYFLFFSAAYKQLYQVYEFQNTHSKKRTDYSPELDSSQVHALDKLTTKFKKEGNFQEWFNQAFEKHRIDDPLSDGYGEWLKSDEGFVNVSNNVTLSNMNEAFELHKKQHQSLILYEGVQNSPASSRGLGSSLNGGQFDSNAHYTDLREAYTQTMIPVSTEDFNRRKQFKTLDEYMAHREATNAAPLSKEESTRILEQQSKREAMESAALAFKYAKESEKVASQNKGFWAGLKQITGF